MCARCSMSDPRTLEIDHVYGDGCVERKAHGSGRTYLRHILMDVHSGRYQILCACCHKIKAYERLEQHHFELDDVQHDLDIETFFD